MARPPLGAPSTPLGDLNPGPFVSKSPSEEKRSSSRPLVSERSDEGGEDRPRRRRRRRRDERRAERARREEAGTDEGATKTSSHPPREAPPAAIYPVTLPEEHLDEDATKVIRRLTRNGHTAYLVGGGVRDLLLGRRPKDFDVATSARPQEVRRLFRNCRIIGRRFQLAHVLFGGNKIIETATFRRDPTQRFAVVPYTARPTGALDEGPMPTRLVPERTETSGDLLIRSDNVFGEPFEDAIRRDFTINGLFYDLEREEVIDWVGGIPDLQARVLRTIGDPDVRFREDPVRILRAIKFSARIDMGIDPEVYDAMVDFRDELERAARPRLMEELLRFLRGGAAHRSIYLAWDTGVLASLLPELASFLDDDAPGTRRTWSRLAVIDQLKREDRLPSDPVLLASLLLGPIEEAVAGERDFGVAFDAMMYEVAFRLGLPRRLKDRVRVIAASQKRLREGKVGSLARREFFRDAASLFEIDSRASGKALPEWLSDEEALSEEIPPPRRRRRRRRR